jgi:hypothetical protein
MHFVVFHIFGFDRPESPQAYVESNEAFPNASIRDFPEEFLCKMQAGGGRRRASRLSGIKPSDSVPGPAAPPDIRRQGHFPKALKNLQKNALIKKLNDLIAAGAASITCALSSPFPKTSSVPGCVLRPDG